jgi:hypothetical protein
MDVLDPAERSGSPIIISGANDPDYAHAQVYWRLYRGYRADI